jgi:hypothetical protein
VRALAGAFAVAILALAVSTGLAQADRSRDAFDAVIDEVGGTRDALLFEARTYSTPAVSAVDSTGFWIDDLCVTAPTTATIHFPEPWAAVEETSEAETTCGRVKAMYR